MNTDSLLINRNEETRTDSGVNLQKGYEKTNDETEVA